jgi:hypothetical protein
MLPSGYKSLNVCYTRGSSYIDTGIVPTDTTEIEIAFAIHFTETGTTRRFIFGARDGTSNTSVGINLGKTYNNGYYFNFNTTNTLISTTKGNFSPIVSQYTDFPSLSIFKLKNKIASLTETPSYNALDESSVASFTGTNTMYLFGLNNNGSVVYAPSESAIAYCKIWQNGTLVRDYQACINESTQYTGLYESVEGVFHQTVALSNNVYGTVFFDIAPTVRGEGEVQGSIGFNACGELIAVPKEGYAFTRWELNGETISNENPFPFDSYYLRRVLNLESRSTFSPVAVFSKIIDDVASLGFKMAVFSCIPTRYSESGVADFKYLQKGVYPIRSASISIDGKQKTTNKFVMDGSFNVMVGDYVYVYSQLGKNIFNGVIESYDETTINCGEMRSLYDKDVIFNNNSSKTIEYNGGLGTATVKVTDALVSFALPEVYLPAIRYLSDSSYTGIDYIITPNSRFAPFYPNTKVIPVSYNLFANNYYGEPTTVNFPLIENTEVRNMQTFVCDLFSDLGIYVDNRTNPKKMVKNGDLISYLDVKVFPRSASSEVLKIGNNNEQIQNIDIKEETDTITYLAVFNSTGTACRGIYYIDSEGSIVKETSLANVGVYVPKVVLSDDNMNTVIQSNLSAGKYNHMITFNVSLDGLLKFDDFRINKRVDFYYGNKLYRSIVTALSYEIAENDDKIHSMKVTLGLARNNLTSKLNLRKVGKK